MSLHTTTRDTTIDNLHWQLCDALVAWGRFSKEPFYNLIDHKTSKTFSDKFEVYKCFQSLREDFADEGDLKTAGRIDSYLTHFEQVFGFKNHSLSEYYGRVTGLELESFSDEAMTEVRDDLLKQLARVNIPFNVATNELRRTEANHPASVFLYKMTKMLVGAKGEIGRLTGIDSDFPFSLVVEEKEEVLAGACAWNKGECRLIFNAHGSQLRLEQSADTIWHEWAHGKQFTAIARRVAAGELPRSMGVMSIIGSDVVHAEAIADTIFHLLPLQTGRQLAWRKLGHYSTMAIHNALVLMHEKGLRHAGPYLEEAAPYMSPNQRVATLRTYDRENPAASFYSLVYGPVNHSFNGLAKAMGREGYGAFLGKIIPQWMSVAELNTAIKATGHAKYCLPQAACRVS